MWLAIDSLSTLVVYYSISLVSGYSPCPAIQPNEIRCRTARASVRFLGFSGTQRWFHAVQVLKWLHKLQMHPQISGIIGIVHTVCPSSISRRQSLVEPPCRVRFHA